MTRWFQFSLRALLVAVLLVCVWLASQSEPALSPIVVGSQRVRNVREVLEDEFSDSNVIRFLSWNGQWIGTDCDTEIQLAADATVLLTEYRDAIDRYNGTYAISESGELTLSLKGYPAGWPTMRVYRDGTMLLLVPTAGSTGVGLGWSEPTFPARFWLFRQLSE